MASITVTLEALHYLGFDTEPVGEMGYLFNYKGLKYLYMPDEDDLKFLRVSIPSVFTVTDENRNDVLEVINKVNMQIKYAKVCIWDDNVWIFYEYRIDNQDPREALELIIRVLYAAHHLFENTINGSE